MTGSFMGRGNQYIQLVSRFCTVNCRPSVRNYHLSHKRFGVWTANLRSGRQVCYHYASLPPHPPSQSNSKSNVQKPKICRNLLYLFMLKPTKERHKNLSFILANTKKGITFFCRYWCHIKNTSSQKLSEKINKSNWPFHKKIQFLLVT